jgi:hypothetical protein
VAIFVKDRVWTTLFKHSAKIVELNSKHYLLDDKTLLFADTALLDYGPMHLAAGVIEGVFGALSRPCRAEVCYDFESRQVQFGITLI